MKKELQPPEFFYRLFLWFCRRDVRDHVEGDLLELYHERRIRNGKRYADRLFILEVVRLFRPAVVRKTWSRPHLKKYIMFNNNFKTGWRNLLRNKSYTALNIIGLAIGIAACLLIFLIVRFETSFDQFHSKKDQIYRVVTEYHRPEGISHGSGVPFPVAESLRSDLMLKDITAIYRNQDGYYSTESANSGETAPKFKEEYAYYAEPQFFDIFDFGWLAGDKKTALKEPNSVVLTEGEANKFFGSWRNAIGKIIRYEDKFPLRVTGILQNTPPNTDIPIQLMISFATLRVKSGEFYENMQDWVSINAENYCFLVLPPEMKEKQFNTLLASFVKKHKPTEYVKDGLSLQALGDMHYNTEIGVFGGHSFSKQLIRVISLIGLFLLIIACVNFINLSTAQAINRCKEVGIRKVLGSNRMQLVVQFLVETFIITLFAVGIAVLLALLMVHPLNDLLETRLQRNFITGPVVIGFLCIVVLSVTFLSGLYPAVILSGFNPIAALKNKIRPGQQHGISLRRALVILQFCIAQALVIGTLVMSAQISYFQNKPLGFDKDAVITVPFPRDSISRTKLNSLHDQFLLLPGVKELSVSFASPTDNNGWGSDFKYDNATKQTDFNAQLKWADHDYFKLYQLQFVAGSLYKVSDTITGYVVNETLLHKLGVRDPKDAIGKYLQLWDDPQKHAPIVGVVKDFNTRSLKRDIPPVIMASWKNMYTKFNIKLQPSNIPQTLTSVEKLWKQAFPDGLYEFQFLDKKIADFYKNDSRLSQLYKIFAWIAIFISCLGLYGLVSFMAIQRTKEVGIRKTLGASVGNIVYLFSREFTMLILISFVIAAPLGFYFMQRWLEDFSYRIMIGPDIFLLAFFASLLIAWATVGYKSIRAALANPIHSLRTE